jgi:hypothetical protein
VRSCVRVRMCYVFARGGLCYLNLRLSVSVFDKLPSYLNVSTCVSILVCFCFLNVGWHGVGECLRGVVCMCVSDWDC